jgi:hypothetical protein
MTAKMIASRTRPTSKSVVFMALRLQAVRRIPAHGSRFSGEQLVGHQLACLVETQAVVQYQVAFLLRCSVGEFVTLEGGQMRLRHQMSVVDTSVADEGARLAADRDRLRVEVERLVASIAAGVPPESVAPLIKKDEAEIARLEARLRVPRVVPPSIEQQRAALQQRSEQWKRDLRDEPKIARLVLRRLMGPMTLWDESERPEWCRWEAPAKPESLLDGLVPVHDGTSPTGTDTGGHIAFSRQFRAE